MALPRRIQLTTLSGDTPLPAAPSPKLPVNESKPEANLLGTVTTVRFELQLRPSNEHRCPEFCYSELVKANEAQKRPKTFEEVDAENERNELEVLAKKFESKYGGPDKPRKDRISDLVDIGDGYDDEDSFIDNSEAYDEFVPSSLTTEHGGFYINSGALQYRRTSDGAVCVTSGSDGDPETTKIVKKRKLRDGGEQKLKKKKKRLEEKSTEAGLPLIPRPPPSEACPTPQKQPRRPRSGPLNLDSVLRKLQHGKLQEFQFDRPLIAPPPTPLELSPPPPASGSTNHQSTPPALRLANQSTLPARITNQSTPPIDLTNQSTPPIDLTNQSTPLIDLTIQSTPPPRASVDQPVSQSSQKLVATPPHGLPSPLRACIRDLTQVARVCEGESKLKFFTQEVNSMLLDVEVRSRELGPAVRSRVFTHLSNHLPFSRDTLLKRARKLTHTPQVGSLPAALQKLKESIAMAMPEQIAHFQDACRTFTDVRNAKANHEGREREQEEKKDKPEEEEEEEGEMKVGKGTTSSPPQKRIHWSKEMRALLCEVVQIKMGFYEQAKQQQPNAEEYLRNFLESEVKSLWPKGWMLTRILLKESHKAHLHLTNTCIRGKKRPVANTKLKDSKVKVGRSPPLSRPSPPVGIASPGPSPSMGVTPPGPSPPVGVAPPGPSPSVGMVFQELAALSADMTRRIKELHLPVGHPAAPAAQPEEPLLGTACPDPSLVLRPAEPLQPQGPTLSPPPGQAAEMEGAVAQTCPRSGAAMPGTLQASLPPH